MDYLLVEYSNNTYSFKDSNKNQICADFNIIEKHKNFNVTTLYDERIVILMIRFFKRKIIHFTNRHISISEIQTIENNFVTNIDNVLEYKFFWWKPV